MKKLIIIILLFVGIKNISAQSYLQLKTYQDTANYLIHEVEMKKNLYINNPFSQLLSNLKIKPAYCFPSYSKPNDPDEGLSIYRF